MNLQELHNYLGHLLEAGVDPNLPATSVVDGVPMEISEARLLTGTYSYDPAPKLPGFTRREGTVLALMPCFEDISDGLNEGWLKESPLPVDVNNLT